MPNFQSMPGRSKFRPRPRQPAAHFLQCGEPVGIRQLRRPDPLHTQRRLAPAAHLPAGCRFHDQLHPRTGHGRQGFGAKFQRNAGLDRQEIQGGLDDAEGERGHADEDENAEYRRAGWFTLAVSDRVFRGPS